jgi:hypothetical protein
MALCSPIVTSSTAVAAGQTALAAAKTLNASTNGANFDVIIAS